MQIILNVYLKYVGLLKKYKKLLKNLNFLNKNPQNQS